MPVKGRTGTALATVPAVVDDVLVSEALLAPFDSGEIHVAVSSKNKYISAAALTLGESPFEAGEAGAMAHDEGDDDDD